MARDRPTAYSVKTKEKTKTVRHRQLPSLPPLLFATRLRSNLCGVMNAVQRISKITCIGAGYVGGPTMAVRSCGARGAAASRFRGAILTTRAPRRHDRR